LDWFYRAIEILLFVYFKIMQPKCEPCLPNEPCPRCITSEQIVILWFAFVVAVAFLVWRLFHLLKKKTDKLNLP
jgi:hypothetical protein